MNPFPKLPIFALAVTAGYVVAVLPARADGPGIESAMVVDGKIVPNGVFTPMTPKFIDYFHSTGTAKGDKLRVLWIAEDVGDVAPPDTPLGEMEFTTGEDDYHGAFSLSKPACGWAVGKYRVELYVNDQLATSVKFTVAEGVAAQ